MDHREVREYLPAYVDEAKGPRASAVEEHLQTCEECRAELDRYRQIMSGLEGLANVTQEPAPWLLDSLMDTVRSRARQLTPRASQLGRLRNPRVAAAGAVVAAGVAGAVAVRMMKRRRRRTAWQRLRASLAGA